MKQLYTFLVILLMTNISAGAVKLEIKLLENGRYKNYSEVPDLRKKHSSAADFQVTVDLTTRKHGKLTEYELKLKNNSPDIKRLKFSLIEEVPAGGLYWDGFEFTKNVYKQCIPDGNRYNFPMHVYQFNKKLNAAGLAPQSIVSRFERSLKKTNGKLVLVFDVFMALAPHDEDGFALVELTLDDAASYAEAVEIIYNVYPEFFRPVKGADKRDYGIGGYFYSDERSRDYQPEESRRFRFSWEWYYQCYQKAGDFFPDKKFWDNKKGFRSETSHAACDRPGSIEDYVKYNQKRITAGNRNAALHYYYIQQYCNSDLLNNVYRDSVWKNKKGRIQSKTFGWAEEGWAQYAWTGASSSLGKELRKDLKLIWENFDIAGFALDMTLGDTKYYGDLVLKERGKAFDDDGQLYVAEGVAIAHNLDYTHSLPSKKDGRRASSITNEPFTYLPVFHGDGTMHEMPPYDRAELIAPRRLSAGQKPFYYWKGFRAESLLDWKNLNKEQVSRGFTGILDYVKMTAFRFGASPAVFFSKGVRDLLDIQPQLLELTLAGWRAAAYAWVDGVPEENTPFELSNPVWITRYGNAENSYFVLSAPDKKLMKGTFRIKTDKFNANGAVYASMDGSETENTVIDKETVINFELSNHQILILKKIATRRAGKYKAVLKRNVPSNTPENHEELITDKNSITKIEYCPYIFSPKNNWPDKLVLGRGPTIESAIIVAPEDIPALAGAELNLSTYYEYYNVRKRYPCYRLWDMGKHWNKKLRIPIFAPDVSLPQKYKVVFVLGEKARKKYFPKEYLADAIFRKMDGKHAVISFFPGKLSEKELIYQLLNEMDKNNHYIGVITDPWSIDAKLYGKIYDSKRN